MAQFNAIRVTKIDELEEAVKQHKAVILVDNSNITKKVKEICEHDVKAQTKADNALKFGGKSAIATAGLFALGFVGAIFFEPLLMIGALGTTVGIITTGISLAVGTGKKILSSITGELKNYKWFESNKKLILYKYKGSNKFDVDNDEVIGYKKE